MPELHMVKIGVQGGAIREDIFLYIIPGYNPCSSIQGEHTNLVRATYGAYKEVLHAVGYPRIQGLAMDRALLYEC